MSETIFNSEEEYQDSLKGDKGDPGKDYILTQQDKEEIALLASKEIVVPVVEKVIEKTEVIKEQPIITEIVKEVALTDKPEIIRNKLEILQGDERLDKKSIKGLELFIDKSVLDRAIGILDQRTSFLINKVSTLANRPSGTGTATSPAGSTGYVQFNNAGAFGADSNLFWGNTNKTLNIGIGTSLSHAGLRINSNSTSDRPLAFTGTGVSVGGGTDTNAGVFAGMGYNGSPAYGDANMQFWIGSLNQIGNDTYSVFRYIVGFDIPMIDGVSANGSFRRNINFGFIDNNVSFGFDVTTHSQADIIAKVDVIGNGTDNTSSNIRIRNSAGTVMLQITDDGLPYLNSTAIFSNFNGGPSGSVYAEYDGSRYGLYMNP